MNLELVPPVLFTTILYSGLPGQPFLFRHDEYAGAHDDEKVIFKQVFDLGGSYISFSST